MLLLWGVTIIMTGFIQQKDGVADAGKASQTDKTGTNNGQGELSEQESAGENLQFGNADADIQEAGVEYPIITEINASWVDYVMDSEGIYCVYTGDSFWGGKYGFLTDAGEEITPFVYEEASPFNEGLACVCLDGKYGYIDKKFASVEIYNKLHIAFKLNIF